VRLNERSLLSERVQLPRRGGCKERCVGHLDLKIELGKEESRRCIQHSCKPETLSFSRLAATTTL
jgi:hypothetical protein